MVHLFMIPLCIGDQWVALFISPSHILIYLLRFKLLVNLFLSLSVIIFPPFIASFVISKALVTVVCFSLPHHLLLSEHFLMLIMQGVLILIALQQVGVFFQVTHPFHGNVRSKKGYLNLTPRLSIALCLLLVPNLYGFDNFFLIQMSLVLNLFLFLEIIPALLALPPILSIIRKPNTLRLIAITSKNQFMIKFSILYMSHSAIKLLTCSLSL